MKTPANTWSNKSMRRTKSVLAGRVLSGLAIVFLTLDAGGKLLLPEVMIANSPPLGLPADPVFYRLLGGILALCTIIYAWPRTAALGAVLLTGYLGGAIAANLRIGSPLLSHTLFGIYVGAILWAGLFLRDPRIGPLLGIVDKDASLTRTDEGIPR